jgi:hypothetical protein
MSVSLPLSAQGNSNKAASFRRAALENIRPLLCPIIGEASFLTSRQHITLGPPPVSVVPEWGRGPGWGSIRAMGVRDDCQPTAVTS